MLDHSYLKMENNGRAMKRFQNFAHADSCWVLGKGCSLITISYILHIFTKTLIFNECP